MKVQKFFSNPKKWTQFAWENNDGACCLEGAIIKCYKDSNERIRILNKVREYLRKSAHNDSIPEYNDNPRRKFADIRKLIQKLDI